MQIRRCCSLDRISNSMGLAPNLGLRHSLDSMLEQEEATKMLVCEGFQVGFDFGPRPCVSLSENACLRKLSSRLHLWIAVAALEHNGKVTGESVDLLEYLENHFDGPKHFSTDPAKKEAANELLKYIDTFTKNGLVTLQKPEPEVSEAAGFA